MLVAISGPQGSGKSTILNVLEERGCRVIKRKTSRSALNDLGVTLDEVNTNNELGVKFQDFLIERKTQDEKEAVESGSVWFTERTFADLFVYTLVNFGKLNEYSDWVNKYYETCKEHSQYYSQVWYLSGGLFDVEYDGVRGSNKHYARMIDLTLRDVTKDIINNEKLFFMGETGDLTNRVNKILQNV